MQRQRYLLVDTVREESCFSAIDEGKGGVAPESIIARRLGFDAGKKCDQMFFERRDIGRGSKALAITGCLRNSETCRATMIALRPFTACRFGR